MTAAPSRSAARRRTRTAIRSSSAGVWIGTAPRSVTGPVYTRICLLDRLGGLAAAFFSSAAATMTTAAAIPRARVMAASAAPERAW